MAAIKIKLGIFKCYKRSFPQDKLPTFTFKNSPVGREKIRKITARKERKLKQ
jgi:hypothetical protein